MSDIDARPPLALALGLSRHPEGGWYRQTWAAAPTVALPDGRVRPTATLIYFLLLAGESSAWHRVDSDELWLAHLGAVTVELGGHSAAPAGRASGRVSTVTVGVDLATGQVPAVLVPAGNWQRTVPAGHDALVSCLVSPGFDFADFELAAEHPVSGRTSTRS